VLAEHHLLDRGGGEESAGRPWARYCRIRGEEKSRRRRSARVDPIADALEHRGHGLRGEDACGGDAPAVQVEAFLRPLEPAVQGLAITLERRVPTMACTVVMQEPLESIGRLDGRSARVADPCRHDEQVPRVLLEELVRVRVQRVRRGIPYRLVDADHPGLALLRVAAVVLAILVIVAPHGRPQAHEEDGAAADAGRVDRSAEGDGDTRQQIEPVELVDGLDVRAVARPARAVGHRQVHAQTRIVWIAGIVRNGEAIAGKRRGRRIGQVERRFYGGQGGPGERNRNRHGSHGRAKESRHLLPPRAMKCP